MRVKTFFRMLRIIAAVTLFFFSWSFGPIYAAVAFAAEGKGAAKVRSQELGVRNATPQSGERFEKALEAIRENVSRAGEKADKGEDNTKELAIIKTKRAEIESSDIELKKEFAATEKKLKDAKLPQEIIDRHYKFVRHYDDNLAELKTNLVGIEQGAGSKGFKEALIKAKAHLEKTKVPSKHIPLDPNNLPNRMVKAKARAPRLKKEEFEKDFPIQKKQKTNLAAESAEKSLAAWYGTQERIAKQKPILVASSGSLSGLLSSDSHLPSAAGIKHPLPIAGEGWGEGGIPQLAFPASPSLLVTASSPLVLAQATVTTPTADDLAETPEVQFTPEIQTLAMQLNHNPVKIYEWVRNNIEFVPTYGSIQGAQMTMETKLGNAFDTASLLIALLRASGISAKYVYGTVEIPIEKAMNWVGGVTDPKMAGTILATNGIPAKMLISGGTYKAVQLEHVYVSAWIDYIPSRGAVHKQGDTWIPLDPSYKQYNFTQGIDVSAAVPFDAQSFANQILSTASTNTTDGSVTNVNSALVQQTMQDYQTQVQNYIKQNYPNATVGDVIGKKEIKAQVLGILPPTLPYIITQTGSEFAQIPANLRETMSFSIPDPTGASAGLSYTTSMAQIAGKKITLSFSPATAADQAVIESYSTASPSSLPAYLINLKPELRIDSQAVVTGSSIMMGSALSFTLTLNEPGLGLSNIDNTINAGEYLGIGLNTGLIDSNYLRGLKARLESTKEKLSIQNYVGLTKDDVAGDIIYSVIATYFAELDRTDKVISKNMDIIRYRGTSLGLASFTINVQDVFGVPIGANLGGIMLDIDRLMQAVFNKDGNMDKVKQYILVSGSNSSELEHVVPEQLFSTLSNPMYGISAVRALNIANDNSIPIYEIRQDNVNQILPQIQVSSDVTADILNSVNAGKTVIISKNNVNYMNWNGIGYIIRDPNTNAAAYMISNGLSGGRLLGNVINSFFSLFASPAEASEIAHSEQIQNTSTDVSGLAQAIAVIGIAELCYAFTHVPELIGVLTSTLGPIGLILGLVIAAAILYCIWVLYDRVILNNRAYYSPNRYFIVV